MTHAFEVGSLVRLSDHPEWGTGQVQSIVGDRVTVNFEHRGKILLMGENVSLEIVAPDLL